VDVRHGGFLRKYPQPNPKLRRGVHTFLPSCLLALMALDSIGVEISKDFVKNVGWYFVFRVLFQGGGAGCIAGRCGRFLSQSNKGSVVEIIIFMMRSRH
jgi:hypothetical protein